MSEQNKDFLLQREILYKDLQEKRLVPKEQDQCPLCSIKHKNKKDILLHCGTLRVKAGPYGPFLSCTRYPKCQFSWQTTDLFETTKPKPQQKAIV